MLSSSSPAAPLPQPQLHAVRAGISLLPPLSRRGHGPGLIVLCPATADPLAIVDGVPWPLLKWAEEGYAVVQVEPQALQDGQGGQAVTDALTALTACESCTPKSPVGMVVYGASLWNAVVAALPPAVVGAVVYADATDTLAPPASPNLPVLKHLAGSATPAGGRTLERADNGSTSHWYPSAMSYRFAVPFQADFHYATEAVSHTRSLTFLKPLVGGPYFDLEAIWEEHTYYEFEDRSVAHTMSTMVQEPYVNHIPTMTGGVGRAKLTAFYRDHFIFNNPADTVLELVSRTVGVDRVIDEFIYKFTHDAVVDWILPGIPPTGKPLEVPFTAIVNIRGDRLYHEHIAWDQGTVLAQLGLLPAYLPFPYPVPGGAADKKYEYRLPVAGVEAAAKLRERNAEPSNQMFDFGVREAK